MLAGKYIGRFDSAKEAALAHARAKVRAAGLRLKSRTAANLPTVLDEVALQAVPQPSVQLLPQMKHVPPFQSPAYKHPTSEGGKWESTIAGPLPPAHIDRATALEEAKRLAASSGTGALPNPVQATFFNRTAEAPFAGIGYTAPLSAANPPVAPALAPFPNGGGVLERGLRRDLKAQGLQRPRPRRLGPVSPSKVVGDGPIGNLCSAAFAAVSSSYAIGLAAVGAAASASASATLQGSLQSAQGAAAQPPPRQPPPRQPPPPRGSVGLDAASELGEGEEMEQMLLSDELTALEAQIDELRRSQAAREQLDLQRLDSLWHMAQVSSAAEGCPSSAADSSSGGVPCDSAPCARGSSSCAEGACADYMRGRYL